MINRVLFATRARRMIGPLLSLAGAAAAIVVGDGPNLVLAGGFLLMAILFKVAAELSGRQRRLDAQLRPLRRDVEAVMSDTGPLGSRLRDAEAKITAASTGLDSAVPAIAELQKHQRELDDRLARVIETLQPIRRHRVETGEDVPDLTLRSSTTTLLRRFRDRS